MKIRPFHEGRIRNREIVSLPGARLDEPASAVSRYDDLLDRTVARTFFI
jgi:hypothetical protein